VVMCGNAESNKWNGHCRNLMQVRVRLRIKVSARVRNRYIMQRHSNISVCILHAEFMHITNTMRVGMSTNRLEIVNLSHGQLVTSK